MLDTEWPEGSEQSTWYLFDLGNDAACDWLCKYYGDLIEENGIDYYRQDFNMLPAGYWRDADEPDAGASRKSAISKTSTNSGITCWTASRAC